MKRWNIAAVCAAACLLLAGCTTTSPPGRDDRASLAVLSSPPEYVSGGDARIEIRRGAHAPGEIELWLNGSPIAPPLERDGDRLEALVTGLVPGTNLLELRGVHGKHGKRVLDAITLTNHPRTGPMFTGPHQMPFICRTEDAGLGQPLADNQAGIGHPVRDPASNAIVGHSRYCGIATRTAYFYYNGDTFRPFDPATGFDNPPADLRKVDVNGMPVPFVVRVEVGTINRFLYTIAMLAPYRERDVPNNAAWNRKLVYWLRGGISIGHHQGVPAWVNKNLRSAERRFFPRMLERGYAIVTSSGNDTSAHYNLRLAEETAMMTKERFIEAVGKPRFTIGMGGSGGAVQQYAFAQNRPGLLDGGIPIQSYPDMITQTIPVPDCHLLEQYFQDEVERDPASRWRVWSERRLIEGMNASDTVRNTITGKPGTTECIQGWLAAVPTVLNPIFRDPQYDDAARRFLYPPTVFDGMTWTHWNDLANIYGEDEQGFSPDTVDNVGVQYGLAALAGGAIDADEFLRINACAGGWKPQRQFVAWEPFDDPFDSRNMMRSATCRDPQGQPAPRRAGSLEAMRRAYTSGHVFTGRRLAMPVIDVRPYLEPQLDMHQSRQPFSIRARLRAGHPAAAARQVIWMTGPDDIAPRGLAALDVLDRYLASDVAPADYTDKCFDARGNLIEQGPTAWAGILDGAPPGRCTAAYPIFTSPRMVAGESIRGMVFKCALKPVHTALRDGTYPASVIFSHVQRRWLERIFPDGVCDYARGDMARPGHGN